jgi:hypothetical protein
MMAAGAVRRRYSTTGGIPVAPSEALDVLYQSIRPAPYRRIRMAIKIASYLPAFFVVTDLLLPITIAK